MNALAFRLARRELRGGLKGFRIFLACLILGVAAIATVQSVAGGLLAALENDGRAILGGDVALRLNLRPAEPEQLADLKQRSERLSTSVEMRAMARALPGDRSSLVELKAVDGLYPLHGAVTLREGGDFRQAIGQKDGQWGVVVESTVLDRLGLKVGDSLRLGEADLPIRGVIAREPDRAGGGAFTLGPRVLMDLEALPATGLIQPGSMVYWNYKLDIPRGTSMAAWKAEVQARWPEAPWRLRDFTDAAPQIARFIERMSLFLTLVGLTALLVGGVGVGNAVRAWLDGRLATIATFKCLGAPGALVFQVYLIQVLAISALGILAGLVLGAVAPLVVAQVLEGVLPITARIGVYPGGLALAAAFGLLTALTFSLWPLGRARAVAPAALFRDVIAPVEGKPAATVIAATAVIALVLAALAVATAHNKMFAAWFVIGSALTLGAFRLTAWLVTRAAAKAGRPRHPGLRLALANLHRPGNPTGSVVLSLGLGLTVLVAVALIEGNFARQITERMPRNAPAFFFVDIQPDQFDAFRQTVAAVPGAGGLEWVPSLRGRIVEINGKDAEQAVVSRDHAWVLRGDRGVTYTARPPAGRNDTVAGQWWAEDYTGPPLLAIHNDVAKAFAIGLGDEITVNILGRNIRAKVAVIRDIDFTTLGINFALTFSPGMLEKAPQTFLATVQATPQAEPLIQRAVVDRFPNVTTIRVKEALDTVNGVLGNIGTAVRVTAAITLVAGTLVLAGAVAAGHRRRVYDAVVLKVLGATRADVLKAFLMEYGLLGLVTAAISGVLGTITAWAVLTWVMHWDWAFIPSAVGTTVVLSTAITLAFGFLGTWLALSQPAAPLLRNE